MRDPEQGAMPDLTFRPASGSDIAVFQQMVQGSSLGSVPFNTAGQNFHVAQMGSAPVGFIAGHKGYGAKDHVLMIDTVYLYSHYFTDDNVDALSANFARDMQSKLKVTHLQREPFGTPELIGEHNIKLVPPAQNPMIETNSTASDSPALRVA